MFKEQSLFDDCNVDSEQNQKLIAKPNSLAIMYPNLLKEWDYEKNKDLSPIQVTYGSSKRVWWKCKSCGNSWKTSIYHRTRRGSGCPKCKSIFGTSFSEQAVFYYFYKLFPTSVFNRYILNDLYGSFEVDIYLSNLCVAVEYDGRYWHRHRSFIDERKTVRVLDLGLSLYRIIESDKNYIDGNYIYYDIKSSHFKNLSWAISSLLSCLHLFNVLVDVVSDEQLIRDLFYHYQVEHSLAVENPKLAKDWNYEKNGLLTPNMVTCNTHQKIWWKCKEGHEWQARVAHRNNGVGCPICSSKQILIGYNDLATLRPDIAKEWDFEKNGDLLPTQVAVNSSRRVWWKCEKGHSWQAFVYSRAGGFGCPVCSGRKALENYNDLASLRPDIVKEWDFEKNDNLMPTQVTVNSGRRVWWKCEKGHSWQALVCSRTRINKPTGCPVCSNRVILSGFNDLKTLNPKLALEWNYQKNGDLLPTQIASCSNKKVWWKCSKCGNEWEATVNNRNKGRGCSKCAKMKRNKQ